ncbi:hypothetical protein J3458_022015 [Metarhizium acridum]|uniref:uncharacterized protein n=1 Tax=Metarhizium acridum TaxID=92637 RepID=UPI001C6CAE34|nr:hypothetical protein J3458_022015 [Metarhizium acridum]
MAPTGWPLRVFRLGMDASVARNPAKQPPQLPEDASIPEYGAAPRGNRAGNKRNEQCNQGAHSAWNSALLTDGRGKKRTELIASSRICTCAVSDVESRQTGESRQQSGGVTAAPARG